MRETIKDFSYRIIGYIDKESNGDKTVRDSSFRILGKYEASSNATKDFYGRILYWGDMASALLIRK